MSEQEQKLISIFESIANRVYDERAARTTPVVKEDSEDAQEMRRICALEYLNRREAALFFSISEGTIDNLIADDPTFPVSKVRGSNRFRRVDLIDWAREQGRRKLKVVSSPRSSRHAGKGQ